MMVCVGKGIHFPINICVATTPEEQRIALKYSIAEFKVFGITVVVIDG